MIIFYLLNAVYIYNITGNMSIIGVYMSDWLTDDELELDDRQLQEEPQKPNFVLSTPEIDLIIKQLRDNRELAKELKKEEEKLKQKLYNHMNEHDELVCPETGLVMVTWKYTNDTWYFNADKFHEDHLTLYNQYKELRPGSRRLIIK
jgi:hypothetical protein